MPARLIFYALVLATVLLGSLGLGLPGGQPRTADRPTGLVAAQVANTNADLDNADDDNAEQDNDGQDDDNAGQDDDNAGRDEDNDSPDANDNGGNDNGGNDNDFDDDNFDDEPIVVVVEPLPTAVPEWTSLCAPAGRDSVLASPDGRVLVVVPATLPQDTRLTLRASTLVADVPPPPGLRVGGLVIELSAEACVGGWPIELPPEVTLAIRYDDLDVIALDERALLVARLDPLTYRWVPSPYQGVDPATNTIAASTGGPGLYTVYFPIGPPAGVELPAPTDPAPDEPPPQPAPDELPVE